MKAMRFLSRALTAIALIAATTSCGSVVRNGSSPVFLVIDSLAAIRGQQSGGTAASALTSDVITIVTTGGACSTVNPCPTIFGDGGQAVLHLNLKDIGLPGSTPTLTSNNQVTITRVHIAYRRTDGRNQEGVDVPYAFDTSTTATVGISGNVTVGFELVRIQAKQEAPLVGLRASGVFISTIADVTIIGQDTVGNQIVVTGSISVNFGNFGDA